jgi:hypothetical protein
MRYGPGGAVGRDSPRRATYFLLLRQKKVGEEKATLLWASLRNATGNLRCSLFAGSAQTRFAQTRSALIREKLRSSAPPVGWGRTRAFASLGPSKTNSQPKTEGRATARCSWGPLWACRGAQLQAARGPRVFERSEFARTPRKASTAGCPGAKRRGHAQRGRLSFAYFSLARQRKVSRPPGRDPATAPPKAQHPNCQAGASA